MPRFKLPEGVVKQFVSSAVKKNIAPTVAHSGAFDESLLAEALRSLGPVQQAAPKPVLPASLRQEAERLGARFEGMQEWPKGSSRKPYMVFTDDKTGSTFGVEEGQLLLNELKKTRKAFGVE